MREMLTNTLEPKLNEISEAVIQKFETDLNLNNLDVQLGVLSGASGVSLFLFYYYKISNQERYHKIAEDILMCCINAINEGNVHPTYCSGLSGLGWVFNHVKEVGILEVDDELLTDLDGYLFEAMLEFTREKNYDFLHGAIGCGFYFLKRYEATPNEKLKGRYQEYLMSLIDELDRFSEKENGFTKWSSVVETDTCLEGYNLSLSHGISSIVNFFARLYVYADFKSKVESMLRGGINYILCHASDDISTVSIYPNYVCENKEITWNSRVAWCYGDLGIALSLWHASKALADSNLKNYSLELFQKTAKRVATESHMATDACVCHGSFGNAQIFNYMYRQTKQKEFKVAAEFWIKDGLDRAIHPDGYANFKTWNGLDKQWKNELSLLEGISGIGLVIMSYLSEGLSDWDECLMIS